MSRPLRPLFASFVAAAAILGAIALLAALLESRPESKPEPVPLETGDVYCPPHGPNTCCVPCEGICVCAEEVINSCGSCKAERQSQFLPGGTDPCETKCRQFGGSWDGYSCTARGPAGERFERPVCGERGKL